MPYIPQYRRIELERLDKINSIGELNYVLTTQILDYLNDPDEGTINYTKYNAVMGVLECIKQELYRRLIVPYENKKITENGDVYND